MLLEESLDMLYKELKQKARQQRLSDNEHCFVLRYAAYKLYCKLSEPENMEVLKRLKDR